MNRDVVIPFRDMGTTEIDFSILSLKNIEHDKVHKISKVPPHIETMPVVNPFVDVENKLHYAMTDLRLSDEFILWNDDFYAMYPTEIPTVHKGYLVDVLLRRKHDSYRIALQDTYDYLLSKGISEPLCFEVHMPMIFNTKKRLEYSDMVRKDMMSGKRLLMRSIYGNLEDLDATYVPDCKDVEDYRWYKFLSTSNKGWNGAIGKYIRETIR